MGRPLPLSLIADSFYAKPLNNLGVSNPQKLYQSRLIYMLIFRAKGVYRPPVNSALVGN